MKTDDVVWVGADVVAADEVGGDPGGDGAGGAGGARLAKTSLQHRLADAAINPARIDAHLADTPRARTSHSHDFAPPSNHPTGRSDQDPE
ncbi:hypothetical protein [Streptomyces sp. HC307]|uniref:hypothetical protein n=1 Tax=Streptomyces flavusporus TaxID=3385496 RepID=UPI0039175F24